MYIECPECRSCFQVKGKTFPDDVHFRCGICRHIFKPAARGKLRSTTAYWRAEIFLKNHGKAAVFGICGLLLLCTGGAFIHGTQGFSAADSSGKIAADTPAAFSDMAEKAYVSGFDFRNVSQKISDKGDGKILEITGQIVNNRDHEGEIPAVQAIVLDNDGNRTESKVIYPKKRTLRPMESASFRVKMLLMDDSSDHAELNFILVK